MKNVPSWNFEKLRDFAAVAFDCDAMAADQFMDSSLKHLVNVKPAQLAEGHVWQRRELANLLNEVAVHRFNSEASHQAIERFWQLEHAA